METIGVALSIIGVMLTIWSIWYARQQAKLVSNIQRNEIVSLWAFIDRTRTMILQLESNGLKKALFAFADDGLTA